jgi:hypothetical protein
MSWANVNEGDHEAGFPFVDVRGKYGDACRGATGDAGPPMAVHSSRTSPAPEFEEDQPMYPTNPNPFGRSDLQTTPRLSRAGGNIGFR